MLGIYQRSRFPVETLLVLKRTAVCSYDAKGVDVYCEFFNELLLEGWKFTSFANKWKVKLGLLKRWIFK